MVTTTPSSTASYAKGTVEPLLQIQNLHVEYYTRRGKVKAAENVSFDIYPNEVF